jgi:hypothetical protein
MAAGVIRALTDAPLRTSRAGTWGTANCSWPAACDARSCDLTTSATASSLTARWKCCAARRARRGPRSFPRESRPDRDKRGADDLRGRAAEEVNEESWKEVRGSRGHCGVPGWRRNNPEVDSGLIPSWGMQVMQQEVPGLLETRLVARVLTETLGLDSARLTVSPLDGPDLPQLRDAMEAVAAELTASGAGGRLAAASNEQGKSCKQGPTFLWRRSPRGPALRTRASSAATSSGSSASRRGSSERPQESPNSPQFPPRDRRVTSLPFVMSEAGRRRRPRGR